MKNKNRTYLLLVAVIAVWGTIGYKLFVGMNPSPIRTKTISNVDFKKVETKKGERIVIQPDYRDPFLGKIYRKKVKKPIIKKVPKKPPVVFPLVQFIGIVSGSETSYILQINGRQEIFKIGETYQEITLQKGSERSVLIRYKGASKKVALVQ